MLVAFLQSVCPTAAAAAVATGTAPLAGKFYFPSTEYIRKKK